MKPAVRTLCAALTLAACLGLCTRFAFRVHAEQTAAPATQPATIPLPANYREWIFLSSGLDMAYTAPSGKPTTGVPASHEFDNVFVDPDSYRAFVQNGTWPDGTTFVLENRAAESAVSINKAGRTQGQGVSGIELHTRRNGDWAFYARAGETQAKLIARPASCYTCHEQHAAVDTTFVQFYPTLLPVAQQKNTLSAAYLHDEADHAAKPAAHKD